MKKLSTEKLNAPLYMDRSNTIQASVPDPTPDDPKRVKPISVREQLKILIDMVPQGESLNPKSIRTIDAIHNALCEDEVFIENADFEFLTKHIEALKMTNVNVYKTYADLIATAEEYKP